MSNIKTSSVIRKNFYIVIAIIGCMSISGVAYFQWIDWENRKSERALNEYHHASILNSSRIKTEIFRINNHFQSLLHGNYSFGKIDSEHDIESHLYIINKRLNAVFELQRMYKSPEYESLIKKVKLQWNKLQVLKDFHVNNDKRLMIEIDNQLSQFLVTITQLQRLHVVQSDMLSFKTAKHENQNAILSIIVFATIMSIGGVFVYIIIGNVNRIILEKEHADDAMRESEEKALLLLNSTGEGIYGLDTEGKCTFCNPACLHLLGYENESQLLDQNMHDMTHHTRKDGTYYPVDECFIYQALRDGKDAHVDDEVLWRADGTSFDAEYRSFPVIREGKAIGSVVSLVDITERKQVDRELKEINESLEDRVVERTAEVVKLSRAVEHSASTVIITDTKGNIEYVNPRFTQTTGYTSEEAIGENPRILKSGEQSSEFYRDLWRTLYSGREWKGEFLNKKKNGELYWEFASISSIKDKDGVLTDFIAVKEDITDRKKSESRLKDASEKAQRATEAKSAFLSSMSHELRTPLNSILGFAQLLITNQKEPLVESQKERVKHILNAGDHLLDLISEVLDLSSIESGKLLISPNTVNVGSVINEAITAVVPMAQQFNIKINNMTNHCDHYIVADRTRLKQVVDNLLTNAIKYNHPGGSVTISCDLPNIFTLRINVEDTGLGIAEKDFNALFEPFNRLGRESLNIDGTGVGLAITKTLVEYMGGDIGIESKVGKGSKFFVSFNKGKAPVLEATDTKYQPEEKHLTKMAERKTMLYVEDDNTNLTLVKNILRRRPNVKLLTALDAESGLELVRTQHLDLILMDINLPKMDGYEALKKLKSDDATKRIPAIAISADAMPDSIKKGKTTGFLEYITKPLNVNHFLGVIDNIFKEERR